MKVILNPVRGSKKSQGASSAPYEETNSLLSVTTARLVEVYCAGPIKGLVDGLRSVYLDKVPIQNQDNSYNFTGFNVLLNTGEATQKALPGFDSVATVYNGPSTEIKYGETHNIRTVTASDLDEVRLTISTPQFTVQDAKTGALKGTSVQFAIDCRAFNNTSTDTNKTGANMVSGNRHIGLSGLVAGDAALLVGAEVIAAGIPPGTTCVSIDVTTPGSEFFTISKDPTATNANLSVLFRKYSSAWKEVTTGTITGKCTSAYSFDVIVSLAPYGTGPYQVRVRRLTTDSASVSRIDKIYWTYYTEVMYTKLKYPRTAHAGYSFDAKNFSQMPEAILHLDLMLVKIPANYDPYTRTYATTGPGTTNGVWDGTFKTDWTNNPAWVFYDIATNYLDGMGEILPASAIDKFELYSIAQYCDGMVPDGLGGTEPRMTCNVFFQTREEAIKALANIASVFRGLTYWAANSVRFAQDRAGLSPSDIFGPANVRDGRFTYAGTPLSSRTNRVIVYYSDPKNFSKSTPVLVEDPELVAEFGVIEKSLIAFGCDSPGQARRVGLWTIYGDNYETEQVQFETGIRAAKLDPGALIYISNPLRVTKRLFGRITASTTTSVTLDAGIEIESGKTYTLYTKGGDGQLVSRVLNNTATASTSSLTFASAYAANEQPAATTEFCVGVSDNTPELFRVISVSASAPEWYRVSAVKHNQSKYDYVERDLPLEIPPDSPLKGTTFVFPPTSLSLSVQYVSVPEFTERRITASWTHSEDPHLSHYRIRARMSDQEWEEVGTTSGNSFTWAILEDGTYVVEVIAISKLDRASLGASASIVVAADPIPNGTITGLGLEGGGSTFSGTSPVFVWSFTPHASAPDTVKEVDIANNPYLRGYKVQIYKTSDLVTPLYESEETIPYFVFDYELNHRLTSGSPAREITIKVAAVSLRGNESPYATLAVTNTAPVLGASPPTHDATKLITSTLGPTVQFDYAPPSDADFRGIAVWVSTNPAFALTDVRTNANTAPLAGAMVPYDAQLNTGMLLYNGIDTKFQALLKAGTFYFIYAPLDEFGFIGANYYGPFSLALTNSTAADAKYVSLVANESVFTRADAGQAFSPASITLTATPYGFTGTPTYAWEYWNGSSWAVVGGATSATLNVASGDFAGTSRQYRVAATGDSVTRYDSVGLYKVTGGTNAVTAYLTNEAHVVPADSTGAVTSWTGASGTFKIFLGSTDVSGSTTFSIALNSNSVTGSIDAAGNYSFTAAGSWANGTLTANITLRGVYNGVAYDKIFTLTKGIAGAAGTSAVLVQISAPAQVFTRATAADSFSPATITLTATVTGVAVSSYAWQYWNGSSWVAASGTTTNSTYLVNHTDFVDARTYRCLVNGTYSDEMTIVEVTGGTNARVGWLTNEAHTVPANSSGTVTDWTGASGTFIVYHGTTDVTTSSSFSVLSNPSSVTGTTPLINATTGVYSITGPGSWAAGTKTTTVTFRATHGGVSIDKVFTLTKSQEGAAGAAGANTATVILYQRSVGTPSVPSTTATYTFSTGSLTGHNNGWTQTIPAGSNPIWVTQVVVSSNASFVNISSGWSTPQILSQNGSNGTNGSGYGGTSSTFLTLGTGAKSLTTQTGLAYQVGDLVRVKYTANTAYWMEGEVTSYTTGTGALSFTSNMYVGSGSFSSWNLSLAGQSGTGGVYVGEYATSGQNYYHDSVRYDIVSYGGTYYRTNNPAQSGTNGTAWGTPGVSSNWVSAGATLRFAASDLALARDQTVLRTLVIGNGTSGAGVLRSHLATLFNSGTGFWMGYDGTTPKFRVGDPSGSRIEWNGTRATITGDFTAGSGDALFVATNTGTTIGNTSLRHFAFSIYSAGYTDFSVKYGTTEYGFLGIRDVGGGYNTALLSVSAKDAFSTTLTSTLNGFGLAVGGSLVQRTVIAGRNSGNTYDELKWTQGVSLDTQGVNIRALDSTGVARVVLNQTGTATYGVWVRGDGETQPYRIIGPRATGWTSTPYGQLDRTGFDTETVTVVGLARRVAALINDLHSVGSGKHGLLAT